jgi:hypothetical protein
MTLVQGRECGECVACCKFLEIPELKKPADVLCHNCTGNSCGIYDSRPSVCRGWYCVWRVEKELPDAMRPDKCGVMFCLDRDAQPQTIFDSFFIVGRTLTAGGRSVFDSPAVITAMQVLTKNGTGAVPVFGSWEFGLKSLLYPSGPLADAIAHPTTTPFGHLIVQALGWRAQYGKLLRAVGVVPNFVY